MSEKEKILQCIVVGDGHVGKTSLLRRLVENNYDDHYEATVFENSAYSCEHNGSKYSILFIDTAGQEEYDFLRRQAYGTTDIFLICFAVSHMDSFSNIKEVWLPELEGYGGNNSRILIGTKSDLRTDPETVDKMNLSNEIFVNRTMALNLGNTHGMKYIECSAKTADNTGDIIKTILDLYSQQIQNNRSSSNCVCNPIISLVKKAFCCKSYF